MVHEWFLFLWVFWFGFGLGWFFFFFPVILSAMLFPGRLNSVVCSAVQFLTKVQMSILIFIYLILA